MNDLTTIQEYTLKFLENAALLVHFKSIQDALKYEINKFQTH